MHLMLVGALSDNNCFSSPWPTFRSERALAAGYHSHVTSDERFALVFDSTLVAPCYALHLPLDIARELGVRFPRLKKRLVPMIRPRNEYAPPV